MKIGIVTEYFYPTLGGITENVYHFSQELLRLGHDFRIITGFRGEPEGLPPEIRQRMIFLGRSIPVFFNGSCGRLTFGRSLARRMGEILRSERFDITHVHSPLFPILPIVANSQATSPVIGTFHTCMNNRIYYRLYNRPAQALISHMAGRIAVSKCCAEENQRFFDADFQVIPNGVDVGWWSNSTSVIDRFDDGKINILFLGRPDTRNGLDTLIESFSTVHRQMPKARLIIVGDGPLSFYFRGLVPSDLHDSVVFEGAANERRRDYLASAHIFCFTPTIASFGITILEGMSAKKAIVASDIEAFRALLRDGESALLVPPKDANALAGAILRLAADAALRNKLATRAFADVPQYDWHRVANLHLEYYHRVLAAS